MILDEGDQEIVREALVATLNRRRPLHWEGEGVVVKQRVVDMLCQLPVAAHVCSAIARRNAQQEARATLLSEHLLERVGAADAGRLVIEQRSRRENERDRSEVRDWFRTSPHRFRGIEHVAKTEPLAWMPDAIAGIWSDAVLGRGEGFIELLVAADVLRTAIRT